MYKYVERCSFACASVVTVKVSILLYVSNAQLRSPPSAAGPLTEVTDKLLPCYHPSLNECVSIRSLIEVDTCHIPLEPPDNCPQGLSY